MVGPKNAQTGCLSVLEREANRETLFAREGGYDRCAGGVLFNRY